MQFTKPNCTIHSQNLSSNNSGLGYVKQNATWFNWGKSQRYPLKQFSHLNTTLTKLKINRLLQLHTVFTWMVSWIFRCPETTDWFSESTESSQSIQPFPNSTFFKKNPSNKISFVFSEEKTCHDLVRQL